MKTSDSERIALRVGAAGAALHNALVDCFRLPVEEPLAASEADAARVAAARGMLMSRVVAYVQVLRESGIRESEIAPAVHRAITLSAPRPAEDNHEMATSRVLRWTADALGTRAAGTKP